MMEQGFVIQSHNVMGTTLVHDQKGWFSGISLSSFPLIPPQKNLSGKEENTSFSPVFPRIHLGYVQDESSCGLSILPPIPVNGAQALFLSLDYDRKLYEDEEIVRSLSFDVSVAHVRAPITASEEQFSERESFENPSNLDPDIYLDRCAEGCIDQFSLSHFSTRMGQSWRNKKRVRPFVQGGVTIISQWLYVMYDDTFWNIISLQPTVHAGGSFAVYDRFRVVMGVSTGLQLPMQHREGEWGVFYTFDAQASYGF
jgi:hypothetical protein